MIVKKKSELRKSPKMNITAALPRIVSAAVARECWRPGSKKRRKTIPSRGKQVRPAIT